MSYDVHIKQLPHAHVVTKRTHTPLAKIGDVMSTTLSQLESEVSPRGAARGVPFAIYHDEFFDPTDLDVELGIPIAPGATIPASAGMVKDLPAGAVAYTTHVGPYASIGAAYGALFGWLTEHGVRAKGPPRESYIVGPAPDREPTEYRTEIAVEVE
jgi:effector-binding domain-containing protein